MNFNKFIGKNSTKSIFPKIYHDIYELERLLFQFIPGVPKEQGVLKKLILDGVNSLREQIYLIIIDPENKRSYGLKADMHLESLKVNCRLLVEF